jgi:hypothetical protein
MEGRVAILTKGSSTKKHPDTNHRLEIKGSAVEKKEHIGRERRT